MYYRILKISESNENEFAVASVNHIIGQIYRQLRNHNNALESYQNALDAGATSDMPLSDKEYGRAGWVKESNNNTWWITSKIAD